MGEEDQCADTELEAIRVAAQERRQKQENDKKKRTPAFGRLGDKEAFQRGRIAARLRRSVSRNPHGRSSYSHALWCFGYRYEQWLLYGVRSRQEVGLPEEYKGQYCCSSTSVGLGPGL